MSNLMNQLAQEAFMGPVLNRLDKREDAIAGAAESHRWVEESPIRFHIMKEAMKRGNFNTANRIKSPNMMFSLLGIFASMRELKKNPLQSKNRISSDELENMEKHLYREGISSIGYTRVPARWVFRDKAIMFKNAIVTTMEMDKVKIATAPESAAGEAAHEIYRYQGLAMNRGAAFLRKQGFAAHAGHPLMGLALYPPLAQLAGLGQLGVSGIFITPEHGPRVRLAAIFTDIENLPFNEEKNQYEWIMDYCKNCRVCIKKCPEQAIYDTPLRHENGQITCVDNDKCFPFFMSSNGCAVCIKVCPFNNIPYEKIHAKFLKNAQLFS
jgi:epoxyqueuosine reductase